MTVDLRKDRDLVAQLWNGCAADRVPLSVAAAVTFHQTCVGEDRLLSWDEYAHALDIAAAALSRLVTIYTTDGEGETVPAAIDLAHQRFRRGASEVLDEDGTVLAPLDVVRGDLPPALEKMQRVRVDYFAPRRG